MPNIKVKILVILKNQNNQFLMIKEQSELTKKFGWNFIRGTYDVAGEPLDQTVKREVLEEVGINQFNNLHMLRFKPIYQPNKSRFYCIFTAETNQKPTITPNSDETIVEAKWLTAEEISQLSSEAFLDPIIKEIFTEEYTKLQKIFG